MEKAGGEAKRKNLLPDLDALGNESLKALVLAKQTEIEKHESARPQAPAHALRPAVGR
jgi:hypothetical protein